ncbi:MAG: NACHT domain-containing protein [Chloroflexota bacterium]
MSKLYILSVGTLLTSGLFIIVFSIRYFAPDLFSEDALSDLVLAGMVLLAVLTSLGSASDIWDLVLKFLGNEPSPPSLSQRQRESLAQDIKTVWVTGVLQSTLSLSTPIGLRVKNAPTMVSRTPPLPILPQNEIYTLSHNTLISNIFQEQAANRLLILGNPGTGKTTTLLQLTEQLLKEFDANKDSAPIPIVFNLSSWSLSNRSLTDWLIKELNNKFHIPSMVVATCLKKDEFILLLDGLDEVSDEARLSCVHAINEYRLQHQATKIVVCSRIDEYVNLPQKLTLSGAIVIQPLTAQQTDDYFKKMGKEFRAIRKLFREDDLLLDWANFPLFLYVIAVAYKGKNLTELQKIHTGNLNQLYDIYIAQMLVHNQTIASSPYSIEQVVRWLSYLANMLEHHHSTVFYLENIEFSWLEQYGIYSGKKSVKTRFLIWLARFGDIQIFDTQWSWVSAMKQIRENLDTSFILAGLFGFASWLIGGNTLGMIGGFGFWLIFILVTGLSAGLNHGPIRVSKTPNQGIWRSLTNGLTGLVYGGITSGVFFGIFIGLFGGVLSSALGEISMAMFVALGISLVSGFFGQVFTFIKHFAIRKLLSYSDILPWRLVLFLEFSKESLLLHRVGGGYKFIHPSLAQYFMDKYVPPK